MRRELWIQHPEPPPTLPISLTTQARLASSFSRPQILCPLPMTALAGLPSLALAPPGGESPTTTAMYGRRQHPGAALHGIHHPPPATPNREALRLGTIPAGWGSSSGATPAHRSSPFASRQPEPAKEAAVRRPPRPKA